MNRRWVRACAAAELVGIATAAAAARTGTRLVEHRPDATLVAYAVVVLGGLVEGTALGLAQAKVLDDRLDPRARRGWAIATVVVAGLGWAAASAPSSLAPGAEEPPLATVLLGAAVLGGVMGVVLGAAQAASARLPRHEVTRWAGASARGWTAAMPVIFLGATQVGADWSWPALVVSGALTGAAAGTVLGTVTGRRLPVASGRRTKVPRLRALGPWAHPRPRS